jgi:uncharacterized protein (TIGR00251 family)
MIAVAEHPEGCLLSVRAQPGARRNAIVGEYDAALKIAVTAPPENGRANDALGETLQKALHVKRAQVELIKGLASRDKVFLIRGLSKAELESRLASLLA